MCDDNPYAALANVSLLFHVVAYALLFSMVMCWRMGEVVEVVYVTFEEEERVERVTPTSVRRRRRQCRAHHL